MELVLSLIAPLIGVVLVSMVVGVLLGWLLIDRTDREMAWLTGGIGVVGIALSSIPFWIW